MPSFHYRAEKNRAEKNKGNLIVDSASDFSALLRAGLPLNRALDVLISLCSGSSFADLPGNIQQRD